MCYTKHSEAVFIAAAVFLGGCGGHRGASPYSAYSDRTGESEAVGTFIKRSYVYENHDHR